MANNRNKLCKCGSGRKNKNCCLKVREKEKSLRRIEADRRLNEWFEDDIKQGQLNLATLNGSK